MPVLEGVLPVRDVEHPPHQGKLEVYGYPAVSRDLDGHGGDGVVPVVLAEKHKHLPTKVAKGIQLFRLGDLVDKTGGGGGGGADLGPENGQQLISGEGKQQGGPSLVGSPVAQVTTNRIQDHGAHHTGVGSSATGTRQGGLGGALGLVVVAVNVRKEEHVLLEDVVHLLEGEVVEDLDGLHKGGDGEDDLLSPESHALLMVLVVVGTMVMGGPQGGWLPNAAENMDDPIRGLLEAQNPHWDLSTILIKGHGISVDLIGDGVVRNRGDKGHDCQGSGLEVVWGVEKMMIVIKGGVIMIIIWGKRKEIN